MKFSYLVTILLAGLCCANFSALAADKYMYKWKGDDGELHYTERPPQGIDYQRIRVRAKESKSPAVTSRMAPKPVQDDQIKKADDSYASWRKGNCDIARKNLDVLENASRIAQDDGEGGTRLMTDEEKKANTDRANEQIEKYCTEK